MRRSQKNRAARFGDAMKFFHRLNDVGHVFYDVLAANLIERVVFERQSAFVQMADHIRRRRRIHI